ncbi:homoprotocatechuate degradation operon regulator HpaR [Sulfitobacter sp. LCG007]
MAKKPRLFHRRAQSLPIAMLRARERMMVPVREMLQPSGLTEQKYRVLRVLNELGPMEGTALANASCLLLPSLTRMLVSMEAEGLVHRMRDERDGRKSIVAVAEGGDALIKAHSKACTAIFDDFERRFGAERVEDLLDLLEDIALLELPDETCPRD